MSDLDLCPFCGSNVIAPKPGNGGCCTRCGAESDDWNRRTPKVKELRAEIARLRGIVLAAYVEGVVDVYTRGATIENAAEKWETCDTYAELNVAPSSRPAG